MPPSAAIRTRSVLFLLLFSAMVAGKSRAQVPGEEAASGATLLDRIEAVVGDRLVMASDVALEAVLAARDPSPVPVLRARQRDPLEALIDAAVIRGLAGAVSLYQPEDAALRERLDGLRSSWEDPQDYAAFLKRFGLDEDRLAGAIYSRMVIERYVHRNVGLAAEAANEDEAAYLARYQSWIDAQRRRVVIRVVAPQHREGAP